MALVLKPGMVGFEDSILSPTIFLAGSIEMGAAEEWQNVIEKTFENEEVTFFNPRRNDWDSSWTHDGEQFNTQVNWELNALDESCLLYTSPSPRDA